MEEEQRLDSGLRGRIHLWLPSVAECWGWMFSCDEGVVH